MQDIVRLLMCCSILGAVVGCDAAPEQAQDYDMVARVDLDAVRTSAWAKKLLKEGDVPAAIEGCRALLLSAEAVTLGRGNDTLELYVEGKVKSEVGPAPLPSATARRRSESWLDAKKTCLNRDSCSQLLIQYILVVGMKVPVRPPAFQECFAALAASEIIDLTGFSSVDGRGRYLHWDELRHRTPPAGLSHEAWWGALKLSRTSASRSLALRDPTGRSFSYSLPDRVLRILHEIDSRSHGSIGMGGQLRSSQARDQYIVTSLMEEAITSSQLEGASTTRKVAKEMLRTKRKPRTKHEQMIFNNYRAMEWVREHVNEPLSPALVFELHRHVTVDTLDQPEDAGRFRRPDEAIFVVSDSGEVLHEPPLADSLPDRLGALCAFANDDGSEGAFMPPIVRAILVHFWLAYDHPFVDGNGRTARALFYWSALRAKYWLLEFITISSVIKRAPAKYGRAFLHAETDDNDATYFIIHQLDVITRAIANLEKYIRRSLEEQRAFDGLLRTCQFNHRQTTLLRHALRNLDADYTIAEHQSFHAVAYQTARTDLLGLESAGLLRSLKRSKALHFRPVDQFERALRETMDAE